MTAHRQVHFIILSALCAVSAVTADEPRMTLDDVCRAADAEAQQHADLKSYTRVEPSYDPNSKTWGVIYRLKSSAPESAGQGVLSIGISDTTGFASTRFSVATPTPGPPASTPPALELMFYTVYVAGGVLLAFVPFERKRTRSPWARVTFLLTAFLLLFVGASELLRRYHIWTLSPQIEHGFSNTLAILRGVVLGFLLALAFSGELRGRNLANA
jgi:hypothetical protein